MTGLDASASNVSLDDAVDEEIASYLNPKEPKSFFLFAGAGSGKTRSLVKALNFIRSNHERELALYGHRVGVITYTNAACDEIKSRIDHHPLFYVSTIHSFAWELIKGFHTDIREWLRKSITIELQELEAKEAKGRAGTKASITRQKKMASKQARLEGLDTIRSFSYSPNGENSEPNALNHTEVISICSSFLSEKALMGWILVKRFPFLLIDESQDTNRHLIDALFVVAHQHTGRFALGLLGDLMQRIYQDGKEQMDREIPDEWGKPSKKLNHRCPKRVVRLINKIREDVDSNTQEARTSSPEGQVRLFICSSSAADRMATEDSIRSQMARYTDDIEWTDRESCKILTLEHHMSAKRLGFENLFNSLYEVDSWRTSLLDGSLPPLRFFMQSVLPIVEVQRADDKFAISRLVRQSSPLLSPEVLRTADDAGELLNRAQLGVYALTDLWNNGEPTCGEVLVCVVEHQLFTVPGSLQSAYAVLTASDSIPQKDDQEDSVDSRTKAVLSFLESPFSEISTYKEYVSGHAAFDTHQGVKGLEFDRVMVIMDDSESRGFMFGYGKLLGDKEFSETDHTNIAEGKDNSIHRTLRLLYVTCSRAQKSLALVAYAENPEAVKSHVVQNGWFAEDEVELLQ